MSAGIQQDTTFIIALNGSGQTAAQPSVINMEAVSKIIKDRLVLSFTETGSRTYNFKSRDNASDVADDIVQSNPSGAVLTRDDTFDIVSYPLAFGDVRVVFELKDYGVAAVDLNSISVIQGDTGGALDIPLVIVTRAGEEAVALTEFRITIDNSVQAADITGEISSGANAATQALEIEQALKVSGIIATATDGVVSLTYELTGPKITTKVFYTGDAVGDTVESPLTTIVKDGAASGSEISAWSTPILIGPKASGFAIAVEFQVSSSVAVADQIFVKGAIVYIDSTLKVYCYLGTSTLTTTTSTALPSADTTNWKELT